MNRFMLILSRLNKLILKIWSYIFKMYLFNFLRISTIKYCEYLMSLCKVFLSAEILPVSFMYACVTNIYRSKFIS